MINTVVIEGRLGNAPELKYANNGKSFLTFSMCYEKAWMVQGQGWQTKPNFFDVVYWKENPEKLMQYLLKGVTVFVQGELKQDTWDDRKTVQKRSKVSIEAKKVTVGREPANKGGYQGQQQGQQQYAQPQQQQGPQQGQLPYGQPQQAPPQPQQQQQPQQQGQQQFQDDIPF